MGLILKKEIAINCIIGVWEITENINELLSVHKLNINDQKYFDKITNQSRKLEWITTRILLKNLLSENKKIIYNENGKPFLSDNSYKISIAHSKKMVTLILSKKNNVAIDVENILSERVNKVNSKFLSEKEIKSINSKNKTAQLYVYWCAKEALYKIFNEKNLNFKKNIFIEPFNLKKEGSFVGNIISQESTDKFLLNYFFLSNYVIVWCSK
ncbi:MAG: 4'-phosphopantetheinyl transferase superfamily protein [Bacteroidetes bacterium]|nr:4'-phosphopantetheinyl transferase superfamily protein [Bacteroidota bacterium]